MPGQGRQGRSDAFQRKARREGYRARSAYKLMDIQKKSKIFKEGSTVLDLGAAPGGWSQVAAKIVGKTGQIIASDILPIEEIPGVDFLQGDFTEMSFYDALLTLTKGKKINTVLSDMAPNLSGQLSVDQPKSMYLAELALDMAIKTLKPNGHFLVKVFQGDGFEAYVQIARQTFKKVAIKKPRASRARSKEVYLLASQLK
mgnify:CR=1 FL=1